ncbi:MAG: type II toxin-antitoxin system RelE/ParE family toxin [Saprospiraceae bacterium]
MKTPPPYDVAFSIHAGRDLREIRKYITQKASPKVAQRVIASLFEAVETLQEHPERYPIEPLLAEHGNYRVIRKGAYEIFYEFTGYDIYVYRVVHSKRDLERLFKRFKP